MRCISTSLELRVGEGPPSSAVQFAQTGPPVLVLCVQTLAIREILTQPVEDRRPMQSTGRSTQFTIREPNECRGKNGGIKNKIWRSRHDSANGRQASRSVVGRQNPRQHAKPSCMSTQCCHLKEQQHMNRYISDQAVTITSCSFATMHSARSRPARTSQMCNKRRLQRHSRSRCATPVPAKTSAEADVADPPTLMKRESFELRKNLQSQS